MTAIVPDSLLKKINKSKIPNHVAVIMDGNGRWAKKIGKERFFGHNTGVSSVRAVSYTHLTLPTNGCV